MGCELSKINEFKNMEKKLQKLHKKVEDLEENIRRLVDIINKIPGSSLQVDHLRVNQSLLLKNNASDDYLSFSFDEKTKKLKVSESGTLKHNQCSIM